MAGSDGQRLRGRALRAVTPFLRSLDIRVTRWSRSYEYRRQRYMRDAGIAAVVDVGANAGGYGAMLRADGYRGRLLSVEPLEDAFRELSRCCEQDALWDCVQCGLGARDEQAMLSVSANSCSSSLLPMLDTHLEAAPQSKVEHVQEIQVRTLDKVVREWGGARGPIGLKLDVQGYEAEVLRGAEETLPRVALLEVELSLVPLYAGQTLFMEMIEMAHEIGLSLVNVDPGFTDLRTGRVLQLDGIFLKD